MKILAVIPARYASTRFSGKPLALLEGKPIIEWVWQCVAQMPALTEAVVATDDERILDTVRQFGGRAIMTSTQHRSGTDRCGEVLTNLEGQGQQFDVVINLQGDEPFTQQSQLENLIDCFAHADTQIATLKTPIVSTEELYVFVRP